MNLYLNLNFFIPIDKNENQFNIKKLGTYRSAEVDIPVSLAVVVPFQKLWVHATSRAVEESHGLLVTWEAPEKP